MLASVAYNEPALMLYGILCVGWTLRGILHPNDRLRSFAIAGALAGFACGVKYTAVPILLIALPLILVALWILEQYRAHPQTVPQPWASHDPMPMRFLVRALVIYLGIAILFFSPWLIRNAIWAGNPVFPEAMSLFGRGHFSEAQQIRWERAHSPRPDQRDLRTRLSAFGREVLADQRYGYAFWPTALLAAALARPSLPTRLLLALLAALAVFWIGLTHLQSRFFVLAIPISALLIALPLRLPRAQPIRTCLVIALAGVGWIKLHDGFMAELKPPAGITADAWMSILLGRDDLKLFLDAKINDRIDAGASLALIGDARAFLYVTPADRLRYRTVFDVDPKPGQSVVDAWIGPDFPRVRGDHYVVIDRPELARLLASYHIDVPAESLPPSPDPVLVLAPTAGK
jgi:hypothetical protein